MWANVEAAHKFIDYLLDGKVGAEISKTILYPTPNTAARGLMDDSYKTNTVIFPPLDRLAKCEYAHFPGPEVQRKYEDAMTRIRAGVGGGLPDPRVGMTKSQARNSSWGRPDKINRTTFENGTDEQWVYGNHRYLYFSGDNLRAIQESE